MKRNLFTIVCILFAGVLFAQDPAIILEALTPNPPQEGEAGTASFEITSTSGDMEVMMPNTLKVTVSFTGVDPAAPTGAGALFFDWAYLAASKTYQGTLNQTLPEAGGGTINFPYTVTGTVLDGDQAGMVANLANAPTTSDGNVTSNDVFNLLVDIADAPLPVELVSFKGKINNCETIDLNWRTAAEINNKGFEVQRMNEDGRFESMTFVEGLGNSVFGKSYDLSLPLDPGYRGKSQLLRLKQMDFNGDFSFSDVIALTNVCRADIDLAVFPNPAIDQVNLVLRTEGSEAQEITIINESQQVVKKINIISNESNSVDIGDLSPGVYFIQVVHDNDYLIKRFVKVKE